MIGKTVSHYTIESEIGQGGMGIVYKATDTVLERTVALKFLPPMFSKDEDSKRRFIHEARAVSALDHPNIAVVHEIGGADTDQMFIVMAYYEGRTLEDVIEEGDVELDDAVRYCLEMARGLSAAHSKGIIHRDIKPGNVMVTQSGLVKILDFGLAKVQDVTMTLGAMSLGTLAYMSPEQAQGTAVDNRTDLWALGVVFYEMLAGRRPFDGPYDAAILYAAANEAHESVQSWRSDAPEHLVGIIDRLLQKQPDERYQSAEELIQDLEAMRAPTPAAAVTGSVTSKTIDRRSIDTPGWKRAVVIGGIVIGLGAVGGVAWSLLNSTASTQASVQSNREQARTYLSSGIDRLNSQQYSLALADLERSIIYDSTYVPAWSSLAAVYFQLNDHASAVRSARQAISLDGSNSGAYYNLGLPLFEQGDVSGAISALAKAVELNPSFTQAFSAWGDMLIEDGDAEAALNILARGSETAEPQLRFIIYKNQGKANMALGKYREAIDFLEPSYRLNDEWPETILLLARSYDEIGDRDLATPLWEKYLQLETDPSKRSEARQRLGL